MTASTRADRLSLAAVALAYPAWVAYGSLFPLTGWRDDGLPPFAFLRAGWPAYWTAFDLAVNLLLYLPVGYLWFAALARRLEARPAALVAIAAAGAMSLAIEVLQGWLPSRVSSNLDLACNLAGAAAGVLFARRAGHAWSMRVAVPGSSPVAFRAGAALVLAWALAQLSPENVIFAAGPGGHALAPGILPAASRLHTEVFAVALNGLAAGLLAASFLQGKRLDLLGRVLAGAMLILIAKAAVAAAAFGFSRAFDWLSTGAQWGVSVAAATLPLALLLPPRGRLVVAMLALLLGTATLLLLPASAYAPPLSASVHGSLVRNFAGAIDWMAFAWPPLALAFLAWRLRTYNGMVPARKERPHEPIP